MWIFGLLLCCNLAIASHFENKISPVIETPTGSFRGSVLKTYLGKDIYSFCGIRYAYGPTGRHRFKHAIPTKFHTRIFDATQKGPVCPQPVTDNQIISEDCLRLNVYTTALPINPSNNSSLNILNRPVFVFIHPGGFITGSSNEYGPEVLLNNDMVLVTINYRLGALGFLSTGDKRAPGNAGLKDQVLALHWVQKNIKAFGGDPNKVTLIGHSAGAWSVSLHIVSPLSKGLFYRAFIISGATIAQNYLPTNQLDIAKKQAQILGCPIDTLDNMFNCFYKKSAEEFGNSVKELTDPNLYLSPIYTPVIEHANKCCNNINKPFLTVQPIDIIRQGKANHIRFVTGVDNVDFRNVAKPMDIDFDLLDEFNDKWEEIAPKLFGYVDNPQSCFISKELKSFYFNDKPIGLENYHKLFELYDDALTIFPLHRFERLMATYSHEPIWIYLDNYKSRRIFPKWSNATHFSIPHYDELLLLFSITGRPIPCKKDLKTSERDTKLSLFFVETAHTIGWKPSTLNHPQYFEYNSAKAKMVDGFFYQKRMKKWDELFPLKPVQQCSN